MPCGRFARLVAPAAALAVVGIVTASLPAAADRGNDVTASRDPFGQLRTLTTNGSFDLQNPFFQDLGTNGRVCFTCHRPDQGSTRSSAQTTDRIAKAPTSAHWPSAARRSACS
jgi:hypothetical protein